MFACVHCVDHLFMCATVCSCACVHVHVHVCMHACMFMSHLEAPVCCGPVHHLLPQGGALYMTVAARLGGRGGGGVRRVKGGGGAVLVLWCKY